MLWGAEAGQMRNAIENSNGQNLVLAASHPSSRSAWNGDSPFAGCGHFRCANEWLIARGLDGVDWR